MTPEQRIRYNLNQLQSLDIDGNRKMLERLIRAHCDILQTIYDAKIKLEPSEVYIETLIAKIIFTSKSIYDLSLGSEISSLKSSNSIEIIDTPSIYILARSIIENFLTLEYLYFNKLDKEEQLFRFKLWEVSGLISRQEYKIRVHKDLEKKQKLEKERIKKLKLEIKQSKYYDKNELPQLCKLDKYGIPRLISWHKLIEASALKTGLFKDIYGLFSNYAHSEYISMIQINEGSLSKMDKQNISNIMLTINVVRMVNSVTLIKLKDRFKSAEIIFNSLPNELIYTIDTWDKLARDK